MANVLTGLESTAHEQPETPSVLTAPTSASEVLLRALEQFKSSIPVYQLEYFQSVEREDIVRLTAETGFGNEDVQDLFHTLLALENTFSSLISESSMNVFLWGPLCFLFSVRSLIKSLYDVVTLELG